MVDGNEYTFKGTLVVVPGDNLASQYLVGYKALNAAFRKCRHCLTTSEDMVANVSIIYCFFIEIICISSMLKTSFLALMRLIATTFLC